MNAPEQKRLLSRSALLSAVALLSLLLLPATSIAKPEPKATSNLILEVQGVRNNKGVVGVLLFTSPKGWPEDSSYAFRAIAVPARRRLTIVSLTGLPPGTYAAVVLHDENENMKLDRGWLGTPREQWGMSRNPQASFSAPGFDRAEFKLDQDLHLPIRMQ